MGVPMLNKAGLLAVVGSLWEDYFYVLLNYTLKHDFDDLNRQIVFKMIAN